MKINIKLLMGILVAGAASVVWAAPPAASAINSARVNGLAWLYKNQQGDGGWSSKAGLQVQSTSAALLALKNAGVTSGAVFSAGVANLANAQPSSTDGLARQIDGLNTTGFDVTALVAKLQAQATKYGSSAYVSIPYSGWGTLKGYSTNVADTALAMATMLDTSAAYSDYSNVICNVFGPGLRDVGFGWSYQISSGGPSNVASASIVPTALAILALKKVRDRGIQSVRCGAPAWGIDDLMGKGATFLESKRNSDGGFGENGAGSSGALETALAYRAIQATNPADQATKDVLDGALNYLISTQDATNGSWANDPFQTALVLQAFPAVVLTSSAKDGVPDVVKLKLDPGANVSAPSVGYMPGNGGAVSGANRPLSLPGATRGNPFSYAFSGSGGTGPYVFSLASGTLPEKMDISGSGTLSGTPVSIGLYEFTVLQTDSLGATVYVTAQIQVSPESGGADTPTLPQWGAILMAALLLATVADARRRTHR